MTEKSLNTNYEIGLEILTPVHVGSGATWQKNIDFIVEDGKIWAINQQKLYEELANASANGNATLLDRYSNLLLQGNVSRIGKLLTDNSIDFQDVSDASFDLPDDDISGFNEIKPLIRTGMGQSYLPGSSIKGALRSVIFSYLFKARPPQGDEKYYEKDLLGSFDQSISRFIRPSDAEINGSEICTLSLFNLYQKGINWVSDWKGSGRGARVDVEAFRPGAKGTMRLSIAENFIAILKDLETKTGGQILPKNILPVLPKGNPIQNLFYLINAHTYKHLEREISFFEKHGQAFGTDRIIGQLEALKNICANNPDACVLRMAFGSGFHGITGDWRFDNHTQTINNPDQKNMVWDNEARQKMPARYKSRKIDRHDDELMGFVKLTLPEGVERAKMYPVEKLLGQKAAHKPSASLQNPDFISLEALKTATSLYVQITKIIKPFPEGKLCVEGAEIIVQITGTRNADLKEGDYIKTEVQTRNKEQQVNQVKYVG